jgi:polysaccharide export outer membrane protein
MKSNQFLVIVVAGLALFVSSCTINQDILFRSGDFYEFADLADLDINQNEGYRIAPNDMLTFQLFSNNGERLNQSTAGTISSQAGIGGGQNQQQRMNMGQQGGLTYLVKPDGLVELPELGNIRLEGLTIEEAEGLLEDAYTSFYNDPYVIIRVTNNRVFVFPGEAGRATVVPLVNMNTTLLEVLAMVGGIGARGNASNVKLIRKTETGRDVYKMDLSVIEGLDDATMVVQAYDIIYVEPMPQLVRETTESLSPIISLFSTVTALWAIVLNQN